MQKKQEQNKKLEREMKLLGWGRKDIAGRIGTDAESVGEWLRGESPNTHYREELCKLFGKDAEELGLTKDDNGASHTGNTMPVDQPTPPPLSVHPTPGHQQGMRRRRIHVGWLVMSITICIVVLLFAIGIGSLLVIPRIQAK